MLVTTGTRDEILERYATVAMATAMSSSRKSIMLQMLINIHTYTQHYDSQFIYYSSTRLFNERQAV